MVNETIARIEKEIRSNKSMTDDQRKELINLVSRLKSEIEGLGESHPEVARSIAKHTEASVQEATRENPNPELLKHSLDGMALSVQSFEVSHPKLVGVINNLGQTLMNIGI
jgi:predicted transcriptional regulator